MNENYILLNNWLYKTMSDNPKLVKDAKEAIDLYSDLTDIFIQDVQLAMKAIAKEMFLQLTEKQTEVQ